MRRATVRLRSTLLATLLACACGARAGVPAAPPADAPRVPAAIPAAPAATRDAARMTATREAAPDAAREAARVAAALAHQRAVAATLKHAAIWDEARARFASARELAELRRRARRGDRAAIRGLRARRAGEEEGAIVPEPMPRGAAHARGARGASADAALGTLANARCNDPTNDLANAGQSETAIATLGANCVAGWNDGQGFATANGDVQGYGWSSDGGATWTDGGSPPHPGGWPLWRWLGDPVLAVDAKAGTFWFAGLANADASHNAIGLARGRFGPAGFAFDSTFVVRVVASTSVLLDKEWLACDSLTGGLYLTCTTFTTTDDHIDFQRSTDGGHTWSGPATLSSGTDASWVQGSRVATGPAGEVAVAWYAAGQTTDADFVRFRRSTDRGASFGAEVTPVSTYLQFGTGAPGFNRERGVNFPSLAIDRTSGPHRGRTYLAWAECDDFLATPLPPAGATSKSELEPDDTPAGATAFAPGQTLQGALTSNGATRDLDWWACTLAAGQTLVVEAASVTAGRGWTLRLFAPDGTQSLAYGGDPDSTRTSGEAYFSFTAPASGTYYLRMAATSWQANAYTLYTALAASGAERGRDQRDVFVSASDDGVAWSAPTRANDDAPGYDDYLPEVAVGADGAAYLAWFDFRSDLYGRFAAIDVARSTDGGATWAANALASSAAGSFTTCATNIAPNMGDYLALGAGAAAVLPVWGDARGSSVDTWSAAIATTSALAAGPPDSTVFAPSTTTLGWTIGNDDPLFAGLFGVTLADTRGWALPAPASVWVGAGGAARWSVDVSVPDTAAAGENVLTATLTSPAGVVVGRRVTHLTVLAPSVSVGHAGADAFALGRVRPNPSPGASHVAFVLPRAGRVTLAVHDVAGARVRVLADGPRPAGACDLAWDGRDDRGRPVPPGAYFCRLEFEGRVLTQRVIVAR